MLARNYNVFLVDMDSLVPSNLHFDKSLQWFRGGHGITSLQINSIKSTQLFSSSSNVSRKYVASDLRVIDIISFILARNYNGFLVDQLVDQLSSGLCWQGIIMFFWWTWTKTTKKNTSFSTFSYKHTNKPQEIPCFSLENGGS